MGRLLTAALAVQTASLNSRLLMGDHEGRGALSPSQRVLFMCISVGLVVVAGLMSGLTLGLMSMDLVELEVLKRSGTPREQLYSAAIAPILSNQHFLLVTLLLCNACAMEALPLFLDRLADPVSAILISVTAVLVFGEILPQAVCSRYGLAIGYYCAWLVRGLMLLTSPISWPIGKLLDFLLGSEHRALFRRGQLKALVDIHGADEGLGGNLTEDEVKVICGALDLTNKTARKSMTPLNKVFMLPADARLNQATMRAILASGHSRIPVYSSHDRSSIIGLILVKELLQYKTQQEVPVSDVRMRSLPRLPADTPMYDMLKLFQTGRSHMVVLTDTAATARAAAEAAAQAVAAAEAAETSSSDSSVRSGTDSPLASILRRGKGRKKKNKFASPLLQPLPSPQKGDGSGGGVGGAWIASVADQQQQQQEEEQRQEQQQQQQQQQQQLGLDGFSNGLQQEVPGFGFASLPPDHLLQQQALYGNGNGQPPQQQLLREQEMVCGSPGSSADGSKPYPEAAAAAAAARDGALGPFGKAQQHQPQPEQQQQPDRSGSSGGGSAGSRQASAGRSHKSPLHARSLSGPLPHVTWPSPLAAAGLLSGGAGEEVPVPIGILTIEDVIEELMQAEIVDETDLYVDNERSITVNAAALAQSLPAQLRLALAPQAIAGGAAAAGVGTVATAARVTVRKLIRQRSTGGLSTAGGGGTAATAAARGGSTGGVVPDAAAAGGSAPSAPAGGGMAVAVSAGLAAAAAAVVGADGRPRRVGGSSGSDRQPLLSATERSAPSSS